jgi:hypothetical protein
MKQRKLTVGPGTWPGIPLPPYSNERKSDTNALNGCLVTDPAQKHQDTIWAELAPGTTPPPPADAVAAIWGAAWAQAQALTLGRLEAVTAERDALAALVKTQAADLATRAAGYRASEEDLVWDAMAPVGREFGSPDYGRLMEEDAKKFTSDLTRWIRRCSASTVAFQLEEHQASDARNVQLALHELGQKVSVEVAASVWKDYSQSLMAGWLSGAETVSSAAITLYLNCPARAGVG